jgi:ATP-dependent Clp protease adaptor protein ClpS
MAGTPTQLQETVGRESGRFLVSAIHDRLSPVSQTLTTPDLDLEQQLDTPWVVLVWNDPVNLMSYVSYVFRSYFGFSREKAEERMLAVHNDGRAVVASGAKEEMERHVEAMHDFGLWATVSRDEL